MGLPRPPGDFDRIYSPPEPPETARRSRLVTVLLVVGGFAVAASLTFVLLPSEDSGTRAVAPSSAATTSSRLSPAPTPTGQGIYTTLPPACDTVSAATVRRLVPEAKRTSSGNNTFGYCGFGTGSPDAPLKDRWLSVDNRLYTAAGAFTPAQRAQRHFDIKWTLAGKDSEERTVTLELAPGLGEQAYRRFKVDRSRPLAIGEVAVRAKNVVVTVNYSEPAAGASPPPEQRRRCLAEATAVAREVLGRLA